MRVCNALREQRNNWNKELEKVRRVIHQTPSTYNPEYVIEVERLRLKRTVETNNVPRNFHDYDTSQTRWMTTETLGQIDKSRLPVATEMY